MGKTIAEIRFEKSRKRLSQVLQNLEDVVKDKIHETAINSRRIDSTNGGLENHNNRIIEQEAIISNLNQEINDLQTNLFNLGSDLESLSAENKTLSSNFNKIKKESKKLIDAIEADILKIEEVINDN